MPAPPELCTARLSLEIPAPRHFEGWVAGHAAAGPPRGPFDPPPRPPEMRTRAAFEALLAALVARRAAESPVWFALDPTDGALVGSVTIFDVVRGQSQSGFVGYHVFNHRAGRGYATEALGGLVELGFGAMGLHRLEACVEAANHPSRRVLGKVGFRHEGTARRRILQRGAWRDVEVYGLTVEDIGRAWAPPD